MVQFIVRKSFYVYKSECAQGVKHSQFFNTIKIRNVSSLHRVAIDYTDNSSEHNIILFHCAAIQISLDPLTYLEKELTIDTYVTLRGNTSAPIQEITEIHIRDLGSGNASGTCMV